VALNFSKKAFKIYEVEGNFCLGDASDLPFKDESFQLVHGNTVLEHIPNYEKAFSEVVRVCSTKGYIVITVPNKYRPDGSWLYKHAYHFNYTNREFSIRELRELCRKNGVSVVEVFGSALFYVTPDELFSLFRIKNSVKQIIKASSKEKDVVQLKRIKSQGVLYRVLLQIANAYLELLGGINRIQKGIPPTIMLVVGIVGRKEEPKSN
jgi:ubiquinone/menaquinone biosynthesis C-methylase UbiE